MWKTKDFNDVTVSMQAMYIRTQMMYLYVCKGEIGVYQTNIHERSTNGSSIPHFQQTESN